MITGPSPTTPAAGPGQPGLLPVPHPGFLIGNWYVPWPGATVAAAPASPGANKITCSFGVILQAISIDLLGAVIAAASAGGNLQLAIYTNGSWGRPATLVASTPNITTTSTGSVSGAAAASLSPGGYWFCDNFDNGTATVTSQAVVAGIPASTVGSTTLARVITTSTNANGVTIAQTFGTWPNFTSGTVWADTTTLIAPSVAFRVLSVP